MTLQLGYQEKVAVGDLFPHPMQEAIYGAADDGLVESVRSFGVLNALTGTPEGMIVSGHRRLHAARLAGIEMVPVIVRTFEDDLELVEVLVHANKQRVKSNSVLAAEAAALAKAAADRAQRRMLATLVQNRAEAPAGVEQPDTWKEDTAVLISVQRLEPEEIGKTDDIVAKTLGVGRSRSAQLVRVHKALEMLRESGRGDDVEELQGVLNHQSVNAADTLGQERGWIVVRRRVPKVKEKPEEEEDLRDFVPEPFDAKALDEEIVSTPQSLQFFGTGRRLKVVIDGLRDVHVGYGASVFLEDMLASDLRAFEQRTARLERHLALMQEDLARVKARVRAGRRPLAEASAPKMGGQSAVVFGAIKDGGPSTRDDIAERTGMTPDAVTKVLDNLKRRALVAMTDEKRVSPAGRPAAVYAVV